MGTGVRVGFSWFRLREQSDLLHNIDVVGAACSGFRIFFLAKRTIFFLTKTKP